MRACNLACLLRPLRGRAARPAGVAQFDVRDYDGRDRRASSGGDPRSGSRSGSTGCAAAGGSG
eukprot:6844965-Prymnesium_polylepis.2